MEKQAKWVTFPKMSIRKLKKEMKKGNINWNKKIPKEAVAWEIDDRKLYNIKGNEYNYSWKLYIEAVRYYMES